jgi:WD40 repeat protein
LVFLPHADARTVRFTPDGKGIIASGWSGLRRWPIEREAQVAKELLRIGRPEAPVPLPPGVVVEGCTLDRDGRTAAVATRDVAFIFNLDTRSEARRIGAMVGVSGAVLSPDATWLAIETWHGSGVRVFSVKTGTLVLNLPEATDSHVTFSPDGKCLVVSTGPDYQLWSVGSWQPGLRIAREATNDVPGPVAFACHAPMMAIVPAGQLVRLVDTRRGVELATLEAPDVEVDIESLCFTPDDLWLIAGSRSRRLHLWDLRLLRRELAAMGLDWDLPPYAPTDPASTRPLPLDVVTD